MVSKARFAVSNTSRLSVAIRAIDSSRKYASVISSLAGSTFSALEILFWKNGALFCADDLFLGIFQTQLNFFLCFCATTSQTLF